MTHSTTAGDSLPLNATEYWQQQALLCQWFSTLLSRELSEAELKAYQGGDADPLLDELALQPALAEPTSRLHQAIGLLSLLAHPRLELAADFAGLFLSDARHSPAPYASLYQDKGTFNGPAAQRMASRLAAAGYAVDGDFKEPADHLAVMLDYLAEGYRRLAMAPTPEAEADLKRFVGEELASWLPELSRRAQNTDTASDFYPALVTLITAFCQHV
ncbi:molecular chaperone TorD [Oceanisphaera litoralis]|uniref:molecular chaperone TorD n=1 Tax=Oceanisphaera litoralis TaxID=225144 RepID=UPI001957D540|nr:molecular chaperone TorD [Oceanisphaera litoralis]